MEEHFYHWHAPPKGVASVMLLCSSTTTPITAECAMRHASLDSSVDVSVDVSMDMSMDVSMDAFASHASPCCTIWAQPTLMQCHGHSTHDVACMWHTCALTDTCKHMHTPALAHMRRPSTLDAAGHCGGGCGGR